MNLSVLQNTTRLSTRRAVCAMLVLLGTAATVPSARGDQTAAEAILWRSRVLDQTFYGEGASAGDLNGDGHVDVVSGPYWYAGPDFQQRHKIYEPKAFDPHGYSDNFFCYTDELSGDDRLDVVVIGFPGQAAHWFENPGEGDAVWPRHVALDSVDNESPTYADLTGDGRKEIVCSRQGFFGYATPHADDPTRPWEFHAISDKSAGGRFTHGLGIGDVNGDGRTDLLEKSGWWEQPASLEGDPQWTKHPVEFSGPGGAQMLVTDVDGDGDADVITSLQAHGYGIAWFEQQRSGERIQWARHMIVGDEPAESPYGIVFSQPHALALADIDGDGIQDIVTGKRYWAHGPHGDPEPAGASVLYWFRCRRTAEMENVPAGVPAAVFEPHFISDASGVGTDVQVHDLNGDDLLDVVVGNKRGTVVHLQRREAATAEQIERARPVPAWHNAVQAPHDQWPTVGQTPAEAAAAMTVPAGFSVDLVAGEPDIHQPVAFAFDARGRIWVAEAHTYPIRAPEGEGQDSIVILEDTDHDGSFDKRTVFAEGLNLISGLEVGFGGVWVGAAPYLMFIPDADGDDSPDSEPQILLDGWGYQDTHETLNTFNWGPDGWLYGCQGVFTHSNIGPPGTPEEERTPMNAGVWRYHPTRHEFEVFAYGTSNPWGIDWDDHGNAFITSCVIPHTFHIIQGARYHRQAGRHFNPYIFDDLKTIADHVHYAGNIRDHAWWGRDEAVEDDATSAAGGGHAHCGALVYLGDNWPAAYRGSLLMANIHGNRINRDLLRQDGSGFIASHGPDLMFANDPWFRGINLKVGPDGSVYVIDWYDRNACHRRSPEIWDRTNGRLFRVRYGNIDPQATDLTAAEDAELVAMMRHENEWHVRTARRVLQDRFASRGDSDAPVQRDRFAAVRRELWSIVQGDAPTPARLRALWTYHTLASLSDAEAIELSQSDEENLRGWAIQLALEDREATPTLLERLAEQAATERSPIVRRYLASALQRLPLDARWPIAEALAAHGDSQHDRNLPNLIWYGTEPLVPADPQRALELATRCQIPQIRTFIYRRAASDPRLVTPLVQHLADTAQAERGREMLMQLRSEAEKLGRIPMPPAWPDVVARLADSEDAEVRSAVQFLSVGFGDASIFPTLRKIVADTEAAPEVRREAFAALLQGNDQQLRELALRLLDDPILREEALGMLARTDDPQVAHAILEHFPHWPADLQSAAVDTLLARTKYAAILLEAIAEERVPRSAINATHVNRIAAMDNPELTESLARVWGSVRPSPQQLRERIAEYRQHLTAEVLAEADRSQGRAVYEKTCGACHRLFGEGGEVGPDLTGADRGNLEYWLENIVDPNAVVGKDYKATSVLTIDGRVVTGLVREETDAAIVIDDGQKRTTIPQADIEAVSETGRSLMPEGQLESLEDDAAVAALLAYLQSPGQVPRPGQLPPRDASTGKVPGAIEGEALEAVEVTGGGTQSQAMQAFKMDQWSGNQQLWWTGGKPGDRLVLQFEIEQAGTYELLAVMTKAADYGTVSLAVDDHAAAQQVDLYHRPGVITSGPISLGRHELAAGPHRLTVTLEPPNPEAAPRNLFGLDYLYAAPAP